MATHSSILAWEILQTEEPGSPWCGKESDTTKATNTHTDTHTQTLHCLKAAAFYFVRCDISGWSGTRFSIMAEQCLSLYLSWNTHKIPEKKDSMPSFNK